MSTALVALNKTKISFFLWANFLEFCRDKLKKISRGIVPRSPPGYCPGPICGLTALPAVQLYTKALRVLLSVHLNNRSIKKKLFKPLTFSNEIIASVKSKASTMIEASYSI